MLCKSRQEIAGGLFLRGMMRRMCVLERKLALCGVL